ncbi:hypothetical protein HPB52_022139 [Rhipicephalus sanguineus]|uniref:Uncharacterized protein n=1 Tax=Rhipicephalus sanguineus TaxID=34632 RepID=A0A9D4TBU8_RHISA|nr:hypothetical protein HPB52_022139 [Rhipicephalus sanguineus]
MHPAAHNKSSGNFHHSCGFLLKGQRLFLQLARVIPDQASPIRPQSAAEAELPAVSQKDSDSSEMLETSKPFSEIGNDLLVVVMLREMAQRERFPTAGHVMWKNDLEVLPHVSDDVSASLCTSVSSRQLTKSYNFAVEAYALPSSVAANTCDLSHILATVLLIALLKKKGFKEAPPELSCTDLPQQWRRPRRQGIQPTSLQDVDWRSPRQDGASMPISTRMFDICSKQDDPQEQLDRMHKLGEGLKKRGNHSFGSMLLAAKGPFVETRLGLAPIGSPLSYQQALLPGGFET